MSEIMTMVGLVYAILMITISLWLLRSGRMTRLLVITISVATSAIGFILVSPLVPVQMQALVLGQRVSGPNATISIVIILILIASSLMFGRAFCGYACPIGAVQEMAFMAPFKKVKIGGEKVRTVHALSSLVFFLGGLVSFSFLGPFGVKEFFNLDMISPWYYVFVGVLVIGMFVYRPFCRTVCPFGFFSSLFARRSRVGMGRKDGCRSCRACEKICPVEEAKCHQDGSGCFLCQRCSDICTRSAIGYARREGIKDD
ncbi:MAG: 4Fe-4S binding protein [Methanomassiliicoccales archaeon]|nr:MAG: 4Fe-4S binding protein [Methanomassiliicoccales archaeon]